VKPDSSDGLKPHSDDWKDVCFCDEFHFGLGPTITKRIKRKRGPIYRYKPSNVHRKKTTSKDTKAQARLDEPLKLLSVFVIVGYNYRKLLDYNVSNKVGKMTSRCYTTQILPRIIDDFKAQDLTLYQDHDSAHCSKETTTWCEKNGLKVITGPGCSPDFSIMETMAQSLKKQFHSKGCVTEKSGFKRFEQLFNHEMSQDKIQGQYEWYTRRLHACREANGQMTKY
jgi:transposase InsO family protein